MIGARVTPLPIPAGAISALGYLTWAKTYATEEEALDRYNLMAMSKRTSKGKARARRNKANHGRKPNYGRN